MSTRIGFWLWYAVPIGAFVTGSPVWGSCVWGAFAATRGLAPSAMIVFERAVGRRHGMTLSDVGRWLVEHGWAARRASAAQLLFVGAAATISVGL